MLSNQCCESSARAAFDFDYEVWFLSDGCAAKQPQLHEATLMNMKDGVASVVTCQEARRRVKKREKLLLAHQSQQYQHHHKQHEEGETKRKEEEKTSTLATSDVASSASSSLSDALIRTAQ